MSSRPFIRWPVSCLLEWTISKKAAKERGFQSVNPKLEGWTPFKLSSLLSWLAGASSLNKKPTESCLRILSACGQTCLRFGMNNLSSLSLSMVIGKGLDMFGRELLELEV